ncbi:site-specific DNA-methyltransferase [Dactylosporangium sp. NBC_01737]|uniref:DNA-methyltransferase n=1 Tax=Dactylosporangium sp. NBC_01737 TaxID=2975959 RepID=UPI002E111B0E|nr:site-specific DNA-methyltransferase [Dactylosporangium sp. NBC_01737]
MRDYGTGRWHGGDPTCAHPITVRRRTPDTRCPACTAVWTDQQYGLEGTLDDYVHRLTAVFDEARRVLTPTGTLWLNLADSYATGRRTGAGGGLPAKNLNGVPWRVAFALQRSGWWLRNAIIWAKKNPIPESVRDRLSASYELLFLLTRSQTYYFDLDPIRVPLARPDAADGSRVFGSTRKGRTGGVDATARRRGGTYGGKYTAADTTDDTAVEPRAGSGNLKPIGHAHTAAHHGGRNPGDVWHIATRPYRGAHVAPFPLDLPLRAIAAGCPPGGVVLDPFSGAATTGLAALHLGRAYIGVDIAADFHDEARLAPYLPTDTDTDTGPGPHDAAPAGPAGRTGTDGGPG